MKSLPTLTLCLVLIGVLCVLNTENSCGQVANATPAWKSSFPNKPGFLQYATPDGSFVIGTNTNNAAVLDGTTGNVLWNKDFETLLGTKKCDVQYVMDAAGVLFLYRSKGKSDVLHVLDLKTGAELWNSEAFQNLRLSSIIYLPDLNNFIVVTKSNLHMIEARTGKEIWRTEKFTGSVAYSNYDKKRKEIVLLNYKTSWGALASGYKNQIMSLNVENGEVNWEQNYFGVIHIHPRSGKPVFEMMVKDEQIYLMVMGLQVLDRNSGRELWRTEFDLYDTKPNLGAPDYTYFYKGIAYPLIAEDAVYLVYNKQANAKVNVQKLDKSNGNLLWEYRVEGRNNPVPKLALHHNKLLVQLGGRINIVGPEKVGSTYVFTSKHKWVGNYGVVALDVANGNVAWEYRKLSDRVTNIEVAGDKVYFADAKKLYAADISSGALAKSLDINNLKCGTPFEVVINGDKILCVGDKGMGSASLSGFAAGWTVAMSKTDLNSGIHGDYYLLKGDKAMHIVNLASGKVSATYKYTKGVKYSLGNEGTSLFVVGPKEAFKYVL